MARTISTKLAVEGEAEYKKSLAACNSELSTLKSSLARTESEFRGNQNSMEAITAKGSALSSMYEAQKNKVSTLEAALKNAQSAQEQYSSRVATAKDNVEQCERALEELKNSTGDTTEEQAALTAELDKWNNELAEAEGYEAAAERGVQKWQQQLNYANVDLNSLSDEIEKNNRYLDEAAESADGCAESIDEYGKEVKGAGEESDEFGGKSKNAITQLSAALAAAGVAAALKEIGEALMECSEAAASFETSVAKVATIADTSKKSLEEIEAEILSLSSATGQSVAAISEATYQAISAGVDTASAVDFVATASKLAAGGFTAAETAVDVLTTALNAYGLSVEEVERVSDVLITTQNLGKTSVGELANSVGKVIPLAAAYGVEIENLSAAYGVLTANGIQTTETATYLKAILTELGDSGATVAGILQEQTGKSFSALMAGGASLGDVIGILGESVDGNSDAFNELWSSTEAGTGALSILGSGAEHFNGVLASMQNSAGATTTAYETMTDTVEFAQQRMTVAVDNLKIAIGTQLNPALEKVYNTGASAFEWATDFVNENPWVVAAVTSLAAATGVLTIGITGLAAAHTIHAHAAEIAAAKTAILNMVMGANPVFLVAAGVTALVAAVGAFILTIGDADEETRAFTESLEESKKAYDDLSESMEEEQKTTAATLDALQDLLEVEEKSAAQKESIAELVDALNESVPELGLAYDGVSDSINMTGDALERLVEKSAEQEEYEAQVARLTELYVEQTETSQRLEEAQAALNEAEEAGVWNTGTLKNNVEELTAAQEANAAEIAELEAASAAYGERQAEITAKTQEMTSRVEGLVAEIASLEAAYEESYQKAFESIEGQLGLFNELDGSAKTSIDNLIETLSGQVDYMNEYAENIKKAMELGVDEGLIQKLSDGSEESAQILAAIVEGGEEDIQALNEQLARVEEGKENFSNTVAEMETDFSNKMTALVADLDAAIAEMDVQDEARIIGADNIQGLINGSASKRQELINTYTEMAQAALAAYKSVMAQMSPSKKMAEAGRFDIQGLIIGAESEKEHLENTYEGLARTALDAMERSLPSSTEEPSTAAAQRAQTDALVAALSGKDKAGGNTYVSITSPEALDEKTAAREFKKAQRDLSLGVT